MALRQMNVCKPSLHDKSQRSLPYSVVRPSKPQVEILRSCRTSQSHKASRCGTLWIKIESSQSYQLKSSSGDSSQNARHGEVDGGKDFCRTVKEPLRKVLGRARLSFNELNTLLIKIEGVINSRPLTAVSDDNRGPLPITPAHLAIGGSLKQLPDAEEDQLEESSKQVWKDIFISNDCSTTTGGGGSQSISISLR